MDGGGQMSIDVHASITSVHSCFIIQLVSSHLLLLKKGEGLGTCYSGADETRTAALYSPKWQLIGMS